MDNDNQSYINKLEYLLTKSFTEKNKFMKNVKNKLKR